jgi:hypothetical protein
MFSSPAEALATSPSPNLKEYGGRMSAGCLAKRNRHCSLIAACEDDFGGNGTYRSPPGSIRLVLCRGYERLTGCLRSLGNADGHRRAGIPFICLEDDPPNSFFFGWRRAGCGFFNFGRSCRLRFCHTPPVFPRPQSVAHHSTSHGRATMQPGKCPMRYECIYRPEKLLKYSGFCCKPRTARGSGAASK